VTAVRRSRRRRAVSGRAPGAAPPQHRLRVPGSQPPAGADALENVSWPLERRRPVMCARRSAVHALDRVGLDDVHDRLPRRAVRRAAPACRDRRATVGPRHLRWSVLTSALLLRTVGALSGVALGLGSATATPPWLDVWTNRTVDELVVDPIVLVATAAAGIVTATAGAWLTARWVARTPVDEALAGRRPVRTSGRRLLVGGAGRVARPARRRSAR